MRRTHIEIGFSDIDFAPFLIMFHSFLLVNHLSPNPFDKEKRNLIISICLKNNSPRKEAYGDEEFKPKRFLKENSPGGCGIGCGKPDGKKSLWAVQTAHKNWGCHLINWIDGPGRRIGGRRI
jgi:hypothetical protein